MSKTEGAVVETELGTERACLICGEFWPLTPEFYRRQKTGFRGFQGVCKACQAEVYVRRGGWHRPVAFPASSSRADQKRGVPKYALLGPCPCKGCGTLLWWAHSLTRDTWDGVTIKGLLRWRELGGGVHRCAVVLAA